MWSVFKLASLFAIIKIAIKGLGYSLLISFSSLTWIEVHEHKPELVLSCQNWQGNI